MAAYSGVSTVIWSVSMGSKVVTLLKVEVSNYNRTGIALTGRQAGMDKIEFITPMLQGTPTDEQTPVFFTYDSTNLVCHAFIAAGDEVTNDTNLHSICGDILFLAIGM